MRKTSSLWGRPPTRYYDLLKRVEQSFPNCSLAVAIIGCSDGKFVLPPARRGHKVLAIDIDEVALYGGYKTGLLGETYMPGLVSRLRTENLSDRVEVVLGDYFETHPTRKFHAVFTSGAVQYSRNQKHSMSHMVSCLQDSVKGGGFFYADYMLPMEEMYKGRDNYPAKHRWSEFFIKDGWRIIYNRVLPPQFEKAHVDKPVDHYHHWGHILAHHTKEVRKR